MVENTPLPFSLPSVRRKKVTAAFDGGRITSDGGGLLVSAITDDRGDRARRYLCADLGQVQRHALGIGCWRNDRRPDTSPRADRAEDGGVVMTIVPHHRWPGADRRPDVAQRALLPHSGFILEPDLNREPRPYLPRGVRQVGAEVFLNASWASAFFLG